jgi:hypothetical protein
MIPVIATSEPAGPSCDGRLDVCSRIRVIDWDAPEIPRLGARGRRERL